MDSIRKSFTRASGRIALVVGFGVVFLPLFSQGFAEDSAFSWLANVSPANGNSAGPLKPYRATYSFGWSGLLAGRAEMEMSLPQPGIFAVKVAAHSIGWARSLWKMDALYEGRGQLEDVRSIEFTQDEYYSKHRIHIETKFRSEEIDVIRQRFPSPSESKWRTLPIPNLRDILATALLIRNQPLRAGDTVVVPCFPGDDPYLVTIHCLRRESFEHKGSAIPAIKIQLQLQKIHTKGELKGSMEPHKKFRQATVWLADNEYRLPLRAEVNVFVGFIYAEMETFTPMK